MREFARLRARPDRSEISPDELEAYDFAVERTERRYAEFATPLAYFGALMNAPPLAAALMRLGMLVRQGQLRGSYSDAERELVDMVLSADAKYNGYLTVHLPDALAVGVRPEAIKAILRGDESELTAEEAQVATYTRQVVDGNVTDESYREMCDRLGDRGALEFTIFIGFLLMTTRLWQAVGAPDPSDQEIDELLEGLLAGSTEIPDPAARIG